MSRSRKRHCRSAGDPWHSQNLLPNHISESLIRVQQGPPTSDPGKLEYQADNANRVVLLENGAVIVRQWDDDTGSSMLAEPRWFYDNATKTFVIPFIKLDADASSDLSRTGIGTVQMKIEEINSTEYNIAGGNVDVTYIPDIQNNHLAAWKNYFVNSLQMADMGSGNYRKTGVDRLVIKTYNITILTL